MTLEEISKTCGQMMEDLTRQFQLPPDTDPKKQIKESECETFSPEILLVWLWERMAK